MKLIMTKGLPGSGKSTWAKGLLGDGTKRINKDDLRRMIDNGIHSKANEKLIVGVRDQLITTFLLARKNVIVDDTNFAPKHEARFRQIAEDFTRTGLEVKFEIKDFTNVPIEVCIANDLKRLESVGEAVIRKMYNQFIAPKPVAQEWNTDLPTAIMCDIDGTLALFEGNPYERDFSQDKLNVPVATIVESFIGKTEIILLSGRKDKYRDVTEKWLVDNDVQAPFLYMRKSDDNRPDFVVKEEIYRAEIEGKYNVLFVLDDRNQVVDLWRSLGLTCLQVAYGNF